MPYAWKCRGCNAQPQPEPWPPGRCPSCGGYWDCVRVGSVRADGETTMAAAIGFHAPPRTKTGVPEFDRVLGNGLPPGSVHVVFGPSGSGKTTLLLQAADGVARNGRTAMVCSAEMNRSDLLTFTSRFKLTNPSVSLYGDLNSADEILKLADDKRPALLVVDSVNTVSVDDVEADEGTVSQIMAVGNMLTAWAKRSGTPIVIVAHMTKCGDIWSPESFRHLVDGVLTFERAATEGEPDHDLCILSSTAKMRFAPSGRREYMLMTEGGLVSAPPERYSELVA